MEEHPHGQTEARLQIIIEQDEAGYYVAECPALRACYTQGKTYEEVIDNIKDVIALCLEDLKAKKKSIPKQAEIIGVQRVEVVSSPPSCRS